MGSESKRREVLQLFKDWRAFETPFGGAFALEDATMKDANYGAAGYIEPGMEYPKAVRRDLKHSYELLEHAVKLVRRTPKGRFVYQTVIFPVYLGDPADPSIADLWSPADYRRQLRDWFVDQCAGLLEDHDLYPVWPERMRRTHEKMVEKRNNDFYEEYLQIKREKLNEGLTERKANRQAIVIAAARHGYRETRAYDIVKIRGMQVAG